MKNQITNNKTLLVSIVCLIGFCAAAVAFNVFPLGELPASFVGAALGAVITGVVTVVLLEGQSKAEEVKERNVKVFEKKSELFLNYIDMLWKAAEDQRLTAKEYEDLRKDYSVRLMIYLKEKPSKAIADYLKALGDCVDSRENEYDKIKENVFGIINVLSEELQLGGKIDLKTDKELEEPIFPLLFKQAVLNEMNRALTSKELGEGEYCPGETLIENGEWGGEYIAFDFKRFKDCKLVIGPFSQYCPDQGGLWMWILAEPGIHEIDKFRYEENKSLIEIWDGDEWAELTGLHSSPDEEYTKIGGFKRSDKKDWGGLIFDDPDSIERYRLTYKADANVIARRAAYWFQHGIIDGRSIKDFLETYLGREAMMIKPALMQKLNWTENEWNKALIGEAVSDDVFLCYDRGTHRIGFALAKQGMTEIRNLLSAILNHPEFEEHFSEISTEDRGRKIGRALKAGDFKGKPEDMTDVIVENCRLLKEKIEAFVRARKSIYERLVNELGFSVDAEDTEDNLYKNVGDTTRLFLGINPFIEECWAGFQFTGDIKDALKNKLQKALDAVMADYFEVATDWDEPECWLVKCFHISKYPKSAPDVADYLVERFRLLEEKTRKAFEA